MLQEIVVGRHLFESPLEYGPDMSIKPGVFVRWVSDRAGRRWRFEIREGAAFRDGVLIDAESVAWNLEERFSRLTGSVTRIEAIHIDDPLRLSVHLSAPSAAFLDQLASFRASLVSPNFDANQPLLPRAGSGPYEIETVEDGGEIVLRRIVSGEKALGVPDTLVFVPMPDGQAMWEALVADELDVIYELPYRRIRDMAPRGRICIDRRESLSVNMLLFNMRSPPFEDLAMRQKVAAALDPRELIRHATDGVGIAPLGAILPPSHPLYPDRLDVPAPWLRDPTQQANCPAAARGSFCLIAQSMYNPGWIDLMVRQLARRQIGCEVIKLPMGQLLGRLKTGTFDAALIGIGGTPDPDPAFRTMFHSDGVSNFGGFANKRYDVLIDRAACSDSASARRECYRQAIEVLHADCPAVFLRHGLSVVAHPRHVEGIVAYPDNSLRLESARITGRST